MSAENVGICVCACVCVLPGQHFVQIMGFHPPVKRTGITVCIRKKKNKIYDNQTRLLATLTLFN